MNLSSMERLPLARKGLLLFLLLAGAQIAFAAVLIAVDTARARDLAAERAVREDVFAVHSLAGLLIDGNVQLRSYLLSREPGHLEHFDRTFQHAERAAAGLRGVSPGSLEIRRAVEAYLAFQAAVRREIRAGRLDGAIANFGSPAVAQLAEFRLAHNAFNSGEEQRLLRREAATRAATHRVTMAVIAGVIANLAFVLVVGGALARSASNRLGIILDHTRRIERGEEIAAQMPQGDEISEVDRAFHRMAETLGRQRRELQQMNVEVESFAYSVSHDLRAPLRAVIGYGEMLQEDFSGKLDETAARYVASMRGEAGRMGLLIDDLLRFSRIGRQALNVGPLDVAAIAEACMVELRAAFPGRPVVFEVGELPTAEGDPSLIRVVLTNLLSNAVKYTAERDAIIRLTGGIEGGWCVFRVQDNGVGFDMRYASKLFAVFQRLHRDDEFEGTGVGLALVDRIVRRHGGRVDAEGAVGSGATFTFTLPLAGEMRDAA